MPVERAIAADHPLMKAWTAYQKTEDYANSRRWAAHDEHRDGSLWGAFLKGWTLATERAGNLHEQINPASDEERINGSPGAGAMGTVIEYRDAIRGDT